MLRAEDAQPIAHGHEQPETGHWRHVRGATFQAVVVVALPIDPDGTTFVTAKCVPPVIDRVVAKIEPPTDDALPPFVRLYCPLTNADDSKRELPTIEKAGTAFARL